MPKLISPSAQFSQISCAVILLAASCTTAAQTVPDAGALQKQNEQSLKLQAPPALAPRSHVAPSVIKKEGEQTVTVARFELTGNTLLSSDVLGQAVEPFLNRPLSFAELQQSAEAVAMAYREAGWIVRAYLPQQAIAQGVVTIQVIEAVFGSVRMQGEPATRVEASQLMDIVGGVLRKGDPLSARDIDRALLLLDDLPGVSVVGNLVEGRERSETDLALTAADESFVVGNVAYDNAGATSTGKERLSANLVLNSPLRMGDAFTTNLLKTQGSEYQRMAYTVPLGSDGLRAGFHGSLMHYDLLASFSTAGYKGTADTIGLDLSYPLVRSQLQNINLGLSYDSKRFDNRSSAASMSNYRLSVYNLTLSANQFDNWGGGGANTASVGLAQGNVNLDGSPNQSADAEGANTHGRYTKLNVNLSRLQSLTPDLSWYVSAAWQTASQNLDSSEKMYLGGVNGVRAFPTSEGGGTAGRVLINELRHRLDDQFTITAFYDYGHVKEFRNNQRLVADNSGNTLNAALNSYSLQGWGMSLGWQGPKGVDVKATVAHRIQSNPLAQTNGLDRDGTLKITRYWVSTSIAF